MKAKTDSLNVKLPAWKEKSTSAILKYALSSTKKMELLAKLVRWKDVMNAINILKFTPKKSAKILFKVVKSALANAKNNVELDENNLYISKIEIGRWTRLKRTRFVGRSRVHAYEKYRTFIRVVLDNKQ